MHRLLLSNNILDVLLDGHGIPSLYLDYPGISIAYWMDKTKAKTIDWDDVRDTVEQSKYNVKEKKKSMGKTVYSHLSLFHINL